MRETNASKCFVSVGSLAYTSTHGFVILRDFKEVFSAGSLKDGQ